MSAVGSITSFKCKHHTSCSIYHKKNNSLFSKPRNIAVLIGVTKYQHGFDPMPAAREDVLALKKIFNR